MKSLLAELNEIVYRLGAYDRMAILMTLGLDDYIRRTYVRYVPNSHKILDLGTGTGRNIPYLIDKADNIISIDISYSALKTCLQKYRNMTKIDIICASAEMLPLRESSIDVVISSYVLRHLNIKNLIRELRRITRRSSKIIIVDFWRPVNTIKHLMLLTHLSIIVTFLSFLTFPTLVPVYVGVWKSIPKLDNPHNISKIFSRLGRVVLLSIVDIIYIWCIDVV